MSLAQSTQPRDGHISRTITEIALTAVSPTTLHRYYPGHKVDVVGPPISDFGSDVSSYVRNLEIYLKESSLT